MPFKRQLYAADWEQISAQVRRRSRGRCECMGECGVDHRMFGSKRCTERNGRKAITFGRNKNDPVQGSMVVLTTAHLCHDPACVRRDHLRAMCQLCHLKYDAGHHVATRRRKHEKATGQGHLFIGG